MKGFPQDCGRISQSVIKKKRRPDVILGLAENRMCTGIEGGMERDKGRKSGIPEGMPL